MASSAFPSDLYSALLPSGAYSRLEQDDPGDLALVLTTARFALLHLQGASRPTAQAAVDRVAAFAAALHEGTANSSEMLAIGALLSSLLPSAQSLGGTAHPDRAFHAVVLALYLRPDRALAVLQEVVDPGEVLAFAASWRGLTPLDAAYLVDLVRSDRRLAFHSLVSLAMVRSRGVHPEVLSLVESLVERYVWHADELQDLLVLPEWSSLPSSALEVALTLKKDGADDATALRAASLLVT